MAHPDTIVRDGGGVVFRFCENGPVADSEVVSSSNSRSQVASEAIWRPQWPEAMARGNMHMDIRVIEVIQ